MLTRKDARRRFKSLGSSSDTHPHALSVSGHRARSPSRRYRRTRSSRGEHPSPERAPPAPSPSWAPPAAPQPRYLTSPPQQAPGRTPHGALTSTFSPGGPSRSLSLSGAARPATPLSPHQGPPLPPPRGGRYLKAPRRTRTPAELPGGGGREGGGGRCACRRRGAPASPAPPARGGKAGWGRGGAGRAAASGAVPGGSPWRPGLAGGGCPSYSRRGTWIKGSSGTWQGQTTSSSSAPTGTGCSSPASPATVSSGEGARSHPLPLPPPPLSMAAAAPAARSSPGSARLPSGARTHAQSGTRGAAAAGAGRTASLRHAGAWRAPAASLSLANHRAGGAVARRGPPRGAPLSNRSGAGWRRRLVRALLPPRPVTGGSGGRAGARAASSPSEGLAPASSGAHVLGAALSPGLRLRRAAGAEGAGLRVCPRCLPRSWPLIPVGIARPLLW